MSNQHAISTHAVICRRTGEMIAVQMDGGQCVCPTFDECCLYARVKAIDYEKILRTYIRHVKDCEGSDFIQWSAFKIEGLTKEEEEELQRIAKEIR